MLPCFVLNRSHRFNHVHVHVCTLYAHMCAYMCLLKRFSSAKCGQLTVHSLSCSLLLSFSSLSYSMLLHPHLSLDLSLSPSLPLPSSSPQVVITYVSYLCHQLLLLRREGRAAMVIQRAWRTHRRHWLRASEIQSKERAAIALQVLYGAVFCTCIYICWQLLSNRNSKGPYMYIHYVFVHACVHCTCTFYVYMYYFPAYNV